MSLPAQKNCETMAKKILVVEDDFALREALQDTLLLAKYTVLAAPDAETAVALLAHHSDVSMIVSDVNMGKMSGHDLLRVVKQDYPHIPMLLITAYASIKESVDAMRHGAVDYLVKPFEPKLLVEAVSQQVGHTSLANDREPIVAAESSRQLLQLAQRVAQSESTVLVIGESGTGKEVLARYVHQQSDRAKKPFVAINCAAIPENMLEAMLFGYEKGAYTGAHSSTPGKFEQANGGTLLLDEISEMDLGLQAKLLRVLQEREVERLGGRKTISLDVRVIATSNRNMQQLVAQGGFREDLYYRLSVLPLQWLPLRERKDDILPLAYQLLSKHALKQKRNGVALAACAQQALKEHPWPGNVRELDNVMQRALVLQAGQMITEYDLGLSITTVNNYSTTTPVIAPVQEQPRALESTPEQAAAPSIPDAARLQVNESPVAAYGAQYPTPASNVTNASPHSSFVVAEGDEHSEQCLGDGLKQREFEIIASTLKEERGSRKNTAERLGISPRTLRYKLAKMRDQGFNIDGLASAAFG